MVLLDMFITDFKGSGAIVGMFKKLREIFMALFFENLVRKRIEARCNIFVAN